MFEKACRLEELESTFNIQASRTTGFVTELSAVKQDFYEVSVTQEEKPDG